MKKKENNADTSHLYKDFITKEKSVPSADLSLSLYSSLGNIIYSFLSLKTPPSEQLISREITASGLTINL